MTDIPFPDYVTDDDIQAAKDYLTAIVRIRHPNSPAVEQIRPDHPAVIHFALHGIRVLEKAKVLESATAGAKQSEQSYEDRAKEIAARLTSEQKAALLPCANNRQCLVKLGLAAFKNRPGHRYPSLKLTNIGYLVRKIVHGD